MSMTMSDGPKLAFHDLGRFSDCAFPISAVAPHADSESLYVVWIEKSVLVCEMLRRNNAVGRVERV